MRLVICNHARACKLTRHEGKMPKVLLLQNKSIFWANFSNRKTQVDKSTNRPEATCMAADCFTADNRCSDVVLAPHPSQRAGFQFCQFRVPAL